MMMFLGLVFGLALVLFGFCLGVMLFMAATSDPVGRPLTELVGIPSVVAPFVCVALGIGLIVAACNW